MPENTREIWEFRGEPVAEIGSMPEGVVGFVYEITHIPTGRRYIGKKTLYSERNIRLGKKAIALLTEERKEQGKKGRTPKKKFVKKESDWKTYCGSNKEMQELVKNSKPEDIRKEILKYVYSKKLLTYYELAYLFERDVLQKEEYLNDNIHGSFFRKDFLTDYNKSI